MVQAYGGDEGWAFIEEASYKLVIDTILPESEESKRENTQPKLVGNFSTKVLELLFVQLSFMYYFINLKISLSSTSIGKVSCWRINDKK